MGNVLSAMETHDQRLQEARQLFFGRGDLPQELLESTILQSWMRCRNNGLEAAARRPADERVGQLVLKEEQERNQRLLTYSHAVMEHLYEQIRHSGSLVVLSDATGLLLQSFGDAEFMDRANRVALQPGASWDESCRGTNAIGTALVEERPVEVFGAEHFFDRNNFLTCSASPLLDPAGRLIGALDISGDYRAYQRHTLGLVRMSAQIIEQRLFEAEHSQDILLCFHPRTEYLGSLGEGVMALSPEGRILAVNRAALELCGLRRHEMVQRDFSAIFETPFGALVGRLRPGTQTVATLNTFDGHKFAFRLRHELPRVASFNPVPEATTRPARPRQLPPVAANALTLDALCIGDARLQLGIDKARRILGRDIPILIQGESGAGKEMFAKAFHNSGPRGNAPFVALNCAAIPETLIESELFGYQGGAFTGARKEGAVGKIQQAHGGTLFLDEIGDMPLHLQARLLRVLQERNVTPLGSSKSIPVDISLICATHRKLKEEVARGAFREDLYYRLNGLSVVLPPLRERTDLRQLVQQLVAAEVGSNGPEVTVSPGAMAAFERYSWPGNIRQLNNVIRVALALLEEGESEIAEQHLPDELLDEPTLPSGLAVTATAPASPAGPVGVTGGNLDEIERQAIQRMLEAEAGNISAAARKLGISRNTLYRKIGRL
ncbi:MAG TPA: sigma-54-dependent Fis family transcriptional regulator [Azospira sp.]|nr:sigma-54-dependent Fis family transcriptional regulator [Azospira sp.]